MMRAWQPTHPMQLAWGLLLWSLWFVVIYATQALSCVSSPADGQSALTGVNTGLLLLSAALTATLAAMMWRCLRASRQQGLPSTARFIALTAGALHGTAALSTVFVALPLWSLPPCL